MSLIPQFVPPGASTFGVTLLLTAVDVVELAVWHWFLLDPRQALTLPPTE